MILAFVAFPALAAGDIFPALATDDVFSRACHRLHDFPRLPQVRCFPALVAVTCSPTFSTSHIFLGGVRFHWFKFYDLITSLMEGTAPISLTY